MDYREYRPSAALAPLVRCIWTLEGHAAELASELQPIVPDGQPELVIHFGDAFARLHAGGRFERQPSMLFAGQLTQQLILRPAGRIAVLGVRLHPYAAPTLLEQPQHELAGLTIDVGDLSRPLTRALAEVRESASSLDAAVHAVQHRLCRLVDPSRVDPRVRHAVELISSRRGRVSVQRVAELSGMTRRHLERRFKSAVGVSPKRLARIARFQHALRILERPGTPHNGGHTAAACGYSDQAHFVRECRELCGVPPGRHLLERGQLTGFFMD